MNNGLILMIFELPLTMRRNTRRLCLLFLPVTLPLWFALLVLVILIEVSVALFSVIKHLWNEPGEEE